MQTAQNPNKDEQNKSSSPFSFWEQLEDLRKVLIKGLVALCIVALAAFCFKNTLFDFILAPQHANFITYQCLAKISGQTLPLFEANSENPGHLISTQLTSQFTIHLKMAFYAALLLCLPYWLYLTFQFVSPGLYVHEKKAIRGVLVASFLLFLLGAAIAYLLLFPFAYQFLLSYRISPEVIPYITIDSYMGTFTTLCLLMGVMFELPVVVWLLSHLGILRAETMKKYRRHACLFIFGLSAIITPTTDIFTLLLTGLPIILLYELSILIARRKTVKLPA